MRSGTGSRALALGLVALLSAGAIEASPAMAKHRKPKKQKSAVGVLCVGVVGGPAIPAVTSDIGGALTITPAGAVQQVQLGIPIGFLAPGVPATTPQSVPPANVNLVAVPNVGDQFTLTIPAGFFGPGLPAAPVLLTATVTNVVPDPNLDDLTFVEFFFTIPAGSIQSGGCRAGNSAGGALAVL
jgi:hypothetical protein